MRKLILISICIGLFSTVTVGAITTSSEDITPRVGMIDKICLAFPKSTDSTYEYSAGVPFRWKKIEAVKVDECNSAYTVTESNTAIRLKYVKSWQFYVNWMIWTVPWIVLGYILRRKNENNRH